MVVTQLVGVAIAAMREHHPARLEVDRGHLALDEFHPMEERPDRADDVRDVEVAGGDLVEHGCEEEEVLAIDEGDLEGGAAGERLLEAQGRVDAPEATPEDHDSRARLGVHVASITWRP